MNNLNRYFEYEKDNLENGRADFSRVLNNIDTRKVSYGVVSGGSSVRSQYFGWAFGFAGFSVAAFIFFLTPTTQTPTVATISAEEVQTLRDKSMKALETVNSINSFDNN